MLILRYIAITLNIIFLVILAFFVRDLRWSDPEDKPALVGFGWMAATLALDVFLIAML